MTELIKHYESLRLKAYKCPAGVFTIGWGCTRYEDGTPVKQGDIITKEKAEAMLNFEATTRLRKMGVDDLPTHKQAALLSFHFNVGHGAWTNSTLRQIVRATPNNYAHIHNEFMKWKRAGGQVLQGLINRRKSESWLYEKGEVRFFN